MTTSEKMEFKGALQRKRQEIDAEIRAKTSDLTVMEGDHDPLDQVQSMNSRDEAATMIARLSRILSEVDRSLDAIAEGTYGVCVGCDEPISPKRLRVIPWASHCVSCQEELERQEASRWEAA